MNPPEKHLQERLFIGGGGWTKDQLKDVFFFFLGGGGKVLPCFVLQSTSPKGGGKCAPVFKVVSVVGNVKTQF